MKCLQRVRYAQSVALCSAALIAFAPSIAAVPKVTVAPSEIEDHRSTQSQLGYMEVQVSVQSELIRRASAIRATIRTAVDETGRSLVLDPRKSPFDGDFDTVNDSHRSRNGDRISIRLKMQSPARQTTMVRQVTGELEIYLPHNDPASVVVKDLRLQTGNAIVSPTLRTQGLTVTVWTKEGYQRHKESAGATLTPGFDELLRQMFGGANTSADAVAFHVRDPRGSLVKISFEDAKGQPIDNSSSVIGNTREANYVFNFSEKLPPGARIKLYVATSKSIAKVPFQMKNLPLP